MSVPKAHSVRASTPARSNGANALTDSIIELVLDLGLDEDDPLPTETELMSQLDVGRNTLREAMKKLQALGIVDIRHGYGTFIGRTPLDSLATGLAFRGRRSMRTDRREARELIEVREALESTLIERATRETRPDDLLRTRQIVEEMEEAAHRNEDITRLDARFHESIFLPLGNRILTELLSAFWTVHYALATEFTSTQSTLEETASAHRSIYEAVAAGNARAAATAMRDHFSGIRARLSPEQPAEQDDLDE